MRQSVLVLVVAALLLLSGCIAGVPESAPDEASPTSSSDEVSIEYVVRAGEIPDEFESITVTLQVIFVDRTADLGPCYPDVFSGPYKPTITPMRTLSGDCHRSTPVRIDLAELEGERSLGNFTAPGSASGHALVVTGVSATHQNGTSITQIYGIGGAELISSPNRPDGPYGVELGIEPARDDVSYSYQLVSERYEPAD